MPDKFLDWFADWLRCLGEALYEAVKKALALFYAVLTSPVWLLPFMYWFIFVREKEEDDARGKE